METIIETADAVETSHTTWAALSMHLSERGQVAREAERSWRDNVDA